MLRIIGIILGSVGAGTLLVLLVRALPRLRRMRIAPRPAPSRERVLKEQILLDRLLRRMRAQGDRITRWFRGRFQGWGDGLRSGYRRLRLLAQEHMPPHPVAKIPDSCEQCIAAAEAALSEDDDALAEERYLACLKMDSRHRGAYLGLSALYVRRKEEALAEETLKFLRRLYPDDAEIAVTYAEVLIGRGKGDAALREYEAAIAQEPRNPRYLDSALELAIVKQSPALARELLAKLREANPENQKLDDFEERVRKLG